MNDEMIIKLEDEVDDEVKVGFVIIIAEEVFKEIKINDNRYLYGRDALDKCWIWAENNGISGDDLYELIDNPECTGISEYAEDEDDLNIARIWSLLVDVVAYTAWKAYQREKTKYLPQSLEGMKEGNLPIFIDSAIETNFISKKEIIKIINNILSNYYSNDNKIVIKKDDFIKKISGNDW